MDPLVMDLEWAIRRLQEVSRRMQEVRKSHTRKFADKILPGRETISKPVKEGSEVEHYMHKFKNKTPLKNTGKPIKSRDQAIAIGLSEAKKSFSIRFF